MKADKRAVSVQSGGHSFWPKVLVRTLLLLSTNTGDFTGKSDLTNGYKSFVLPPLTH